MKAWAIRKRLNVSPAADKQLVKMSRKLESQESGKPIEEIDPAILEAKKQEEELEAVEFARSVDPAFFRTAGLVKLQILYGIDSHNFDGEPKAPDEAWVSEVMKWEDIASEIANIAKVYNSPLSKSPQEKTDEGEDQTSGTSSLQPNGNTEGNDGTTTEATRESQTS